MATHLMVRDEEPNAEKAVAQLLRAVGEDPRREGLEKTPERVARALAFLTSGASKAPEDVLNGAVFREPYEGMVLVQDIEFYSLCEHHLLPFHGRAHIAYLPAGRVLGLSKLPRLLDIYARRLQVQERLTEEVARAVQQAIGPRGVAVRIEAAHFCMMMRGVEKQQSLTITTSFLGAFDRGMDLRQEFFSSLRPLPRGENAGPRETRVRASFLSSPAWDDAAPGVAEGPDEHEAGRFGVLAPDPPPVPRGKYPQRVGPRPRLPRRRATRGGWPASTSSSRGPGFVECPDRP